MVIMLDDGTKRYYKRAMGFSVTLSFANARDVPPAPSDDDARSLRQKMIALYRENAAEAVMVTVALRHERGCGLFLDITLTDDSSMKKEALPFGEETIDPETGTQKTVMAFYLTRGEISRAKARVDSLEKLVDDARL